MAGEVVQGPQQEKTKKHLRYTKPAVKQDGILPSILEEAAGAPRGSNAGLNQGRRLEGTGFYDRGECERVISLNDQEGKDLGATIVLGRDRPNHIGTGYGGKSDTQCYAIRLTAGHGSCNPGKYGMKGHYPDFVPDKRSTADHEFAMKNFVNPNNYWDGALIYLSQKTDVDKDFSCHVGSMKQPVVGRSAAVVKADALRFISRDGGIKIIANTDRLHSGGFPTRSTSTIDFIINNDADGNRLQPLVLGDNLREFLFSLKDAVDELRMQISSLQKEYIKMLGEIASHSHGMPNSMVVSGRFVEGTIPPIPHTVGTWKVSPFNPGMGALPEDQPEIATDVSFSLALAVSNAITFVAQNTTPNLEMIRVHLDNMESHYLSNGRLRKNYFHPDELEGGLTKGSGYILSEGVNTT